MGGEDRRRKNVGVRIEKAYYDGTVFQLAKSTIIYCWVLIVFVPTAQYPAFHVRLEVNIGHYWMKAPQKCRVLDWLSVNFNRRSE